MRFQFHSPAIFTGILEAFRADNLLTLSLYVAGSRPSRTCVG